MTLAKIELNEKLYQELVSVDELIAKHGIAENEKLTRKFIDQRRQLFAEYEQSLAAMVVSQPKLGAVHLYKADPELAEFIGLWCGQIRNLEFRPVYLADAEYCQRFVDCYLPKSWNWDTDFVLLINPFDRKILLELARRGQKKVIILRTKTSTFFEEDVKNKFSEFWEITSLEELEQALFLYPLRVNNVCHLDCLGQSETEIDTAKINKIVKESIYVRQINMNTIGRHSLTWVSNTIKNLPNIAKHPNVSSISLGGSKTGVVVSPGPSLEKNVHLLKPFSNSIFVICPVRSVPILRANGIEPDFVVQLDAIGGKFLENSTDLIGAPIQNLVLDATVDPGFFDFPAEKKFWYFSQSKTLGLEPYIDVGTLGLEAVSVSIACLRFAYKLGLKKCVLVGQDLAFSEGKRYSKGGELGGVMPGSGGHPPDILVDGYYGGKVGTPPDYDLFIDQFSDLGKEMFDAGCDMYNCTEGGAFIKNFQHVPLADVLEYINVQDKKVISTKNDPKRDLESLSRFCKDADKQISRVENYGKRALEIEKKNDLSSDDVRNRDKYLRKMTKYADQSKILWWAFQDILMNTQQLTFRKENISDLRSFLNEIIEIMVAIRGHVSLTETRLLEELNSKQK